MLLRDAPTIDVRPELAAERRALLGLLGSLAADEWAAPSAAPDWTVRDLALHLLDDDLGWLSRDRDGDTSSYLHERGEALVTALAAKNQRWIDGARGLSARVLVDLLEWSGRQMDAYYSAMDLGGEGEVTWADEDTVPVWFDICQDLTERWVHQMQLREAIGRVEDYAERYLPLVLRTFVWAFPHQYRADAAEGTTVRLDLAAGGVWTLTCSGPSAWVLDEGAPTHPDASASFSDDAGWRSLTGASVPAGGVVLDGPAALVEPLLEVRGILV
ncbi:MAG: maleylpyruvate isomerase family mycothiol-dependent enzyme [Actinomycetales bacterium]|nr:maleylpyruvate isomerase family mycothiol-dependent enzyme [Actinomycetales bacterium]